MPVLVTYQSKVADMEGMFSNAERFDGDISKWDASRVIKMALMFVDGKFNGVISKCLTDVESMLISTLELIAN